MTAFIGAHGFKSATKLDGDNFLNYSTLVVTFHTFPNDYMIKD